MFKLKESPKGPPHLFCFSFFLFPFFSSGEFFYLKVMIMLF